MRAGSVKRYGDMKLYTRAAAANAARFTLGEMRVPKKLI